jgi:hypothetical protein
VVHRDAPQLVADVARRGQAGALGVVDAEPLSARLSPSVSMSALPSTTASSLMTRPFGAAFQSPSVRS